MMIVLIILLALALTAVAVLWTKQRREARELREALADLYDWSRLPTPTRLPVLPVTGTAAPLNEILAPILDELVAGRRLLRDHDRQLLSLLNALREPVALHTDQLVYANQAFASLLGADTVDEVIGRSLTACVPSEYMGLIEVHLERARSGAPVPARVELELNPTPDQLARVELSQRPIEYQSSNALLLTLTEMSPRAGGVATARQRLTAWEMLESLGEGIVTTDALGRIEYLNRAAEQLSGVLMADAVGRTLPDLIALVDETDRRPLTDPVQQSLQSQTRVNAGRRSLMIARGGSDERPVDVSVSPLRSPYGELLGSVVLLRDVSELRGLTRQMSYQASHDALTGLVNRREFERCVQESIETAHATGAHHVLCYLDLDRFKNINDTSGHLAGDGMLREVAALIKDAVRDSDTVGRLGGDEFGLILSGCPLEKATHIAEDVVRKIADYRFVWKDKIYTIGVSIGLIEISRETGTVEEVLSAADSACYVAKRQGNHVHVYSARDEAGARQRGEIHWLQRLQVALKENQFELMAQPIVACNAALRDEGPALEVLLRLHDDHVEGGIQPIEFLRSAERYRLMTEVDHWVVQTALTALGRGGIRLPEGRSLAINLSGQTLGDPQFLEFVVETLDRTGVAPSQVCFEVTENAVMTNIEHARRFIGVLHSMGCRFALDDFGRGLSSFGSLKNLAIDYLKIDGSFIRNLATDTVNQAMVAAMVKLARSLNFKVVAEQVEDASALEAARRMGVDYVQGFELARPQPLARVVTKLAS